MKIAKETWVILFIGIADLITTIIFIQHHGAEEANPIFRRYWEMGLAAFIIAKMLLLVGPLVVLEWARKRNPRFVNWALRGAIAAYLIMYGVGFAHLNNPTARANEIASSVPPLPPAYFEMPAIHKNLAHRGFPTKPRPAILLKDTSNSQNSVTVTSY